MATRPHTLTQAPTVPLTPTSQSAEGKLEMINDLIAAKAGINFKDRWGAAAMDEAVKHGHEAVIGVLRAAGGALGKEPARLAGALCSLVYAGDTAAIKLYVMAGAPLDAPDYDKRVALHIAARMCLPGAVGCGRGGRTPGQRAPPRPTCSTTTTTTHCAGGRGQAGHGARARRGRGRPRLCRPLGRHSPAGGGRARAW